MSELVALRDNEGTGMAREHLATCEVCSKEFELLHQRVARLKSLSEFRPPRDRWEAVRSQVIAERRSVRRWLVLSGAAAAAVIALAVGVSQIGERQVEDSAAQAMIDLLAESQRLEGMLLTVGREGRVMNGITAAAIADLEDRIALIDAGISEAQSRRYAPADVRGLWEQRVSLMGALVNTHARQVSYVGF
jgi:hypothetical protein